MKAKTIFFVIIMLIVARLAYAYDIVPTCTSCNRQIRTATDHARNCPYYPKSSTSSQGSGGYSGHYGGSPYAVTTVLSSGLKSRPGNCPIRPGSSRERRLGNKGS